MNTSRIEPAAGGAGQIFYAGVMIVALAIGALQMARVRGGVVTDYGADVFGTAWLYGMFRQGRTIFQRGRTAGAAATAVFVLAGCAASELAQKAHVFPGVFDRVDLGVFAVTILLCYLLDRRIDLSGVGAVCKDGRQSR